jgi:23S rRNA maturation-related 3'-5' exoribonuclease YhaM
LKEIYKFKKAVTIEFRNIPMKQRYDALLAKINDRKEAVNRFINILHTETTWLTSPASTKYHLNKEGGLLEHSVGVAETLLQLRAALAPEISEESCVIVGLFHDIGKVGMPGKPYYLPEIKDGKPTGAYTINPEIVAMGLSLRGCILFHSISLFQMQRRRR